MRNLLGHRERLLPVQNGVSYADSVTTGGEYCSKHQMTSTRDKTETKTASVHATKYNTTNVVVVHCCSAGGAELKVMTNQVQYFVS